jgi:hypothetical protein
MLTRHTEQRPRMILFRLAHMITNLPPYAANNSVGRHQPMRDCIGPKYLRFMCSHRPVSAHWVVRSVGREVTLRWCTLSARFALWSHAVTRIAAARALIRNLCLPSCRRPHRAEIGEIKLPSRSTRRSTIAAERQDLAMRAPSSSHLPCAVRSGAYRRVCCI